MKITIQGQDYSATLDASSPLTIKRTLNEPSTCELSLCLPAAGGPAAPARNQTLAIVGDDGTIYFTGYIVDSPVPVYAGLGLEGPRYRTRIAALSGEFLLDQLLMPPSAGSAGQTAGALLSTLVAQAGVHAISAQGVTLAASVNYFAPNAGAPWSKSAGAIADQARASYRVLNGQLSLSPIQSTVHALNEFDGSLDLGGLSLSTAAKRMTANDITVCGENEPVAYVTEYFLGDGLTTQFYLAQAPYFPSTSKSTIISELFNEATINTQLWTNTGAQGYFSIGTGGLVMQGGSGIDGQTVMTWINPVEMNGTLLLEATGLSLSAGSSGIVAGFFAGGTQASNCTAGFQATAASGSGTVTLQPLVQGLAAGTAYVLNPANQYTVRARVHCSECVRALAVYRSSDDSGVVAAGGEWHLAPGKVQLEIQEFVNGVASMPVALYDGAIAGTPGVCTIVAASSLSLAGAMRSLNLTNLGSGWVVSTPPSGGSYSRRLGTTAEAAECHLERTGRVAFYTGFVPVAGEQIAVSYRTLGRAVGRQINAASQQALVQAGMPASATWIGSVTNPPARCSADCRNAAMAMQQAASSVSALWSGTYRATRASFGNDVWPGDALLLNSPSAGLDTQVVVRTVKLTYGASFQDLVEYTITFANDWAEDLAIKTSATVPENTWLPSIAGPTVLSNLPGLSVTALSGSAVTINTGVTPPINGGFEIRRRDFAFMAGEDPGLVMRSGLPSITFARESANDRFYIRMYDGAAPPNYSEFSTALFINLPLSS